MTKLHQIIAVEKGVKSRVYGALTELNKVVQKPDLFIGMTRKYQPHSETDTALPDESKKVQFSTPQVIDSVTKHLNEIFEITAQKDWTNQGAKADVVVDGQTILSGVPVSYLLFLEKQLGDLRTLVGNLPVLDPSEDWTFDQNAGVHKTQAVETIKTKKVQKPLVLYPATDAHPAQTQLVTEDVSAGTWSQTKQSGAIPRNKKVDMSGRIEKLLKAVKMAREDANSVDIKATIPDTSKVLNYVFSPTA